MCCLLLLSLRIPHIDEAHAYSIAAHTHLPDWIILPKYEGHFFLWFTCLKLVQWLPLAYPWDMYLLNWIVMGTAIYLLVFKSPFRALTKALFAGSYALLSFYAAYSRCYSLLILCLFWICILFPKRIQRPYLFFCGVFLLSQTCIMGTVAAIAFGLIWGVDLLTAWRKKQLAGRTVWVCAGLSILTGILLWIEIHGYRVPVYDLEAYLEHDIRVLPPWAWVELVCFTLFGVLLHKNWRVVMWYILTVVGLLLIHFQVYSLEEWHFLLVFIFAIAALWLFDGKKYKKTACVLVCLLMVCSYLDFHHREGIFYYFKFPWYKRIVNENAQLLTQSTVFITTLHLSPVVPWLYKLQVTPYSVETGLELYSVQNVKLFHQMHSGWDAQIPYQKIKDRIDPSRPALLIGQRSEIPRIIYRGGDDRRFTFERLECASGGRKNMQPCIFRMIPDPDDRRRHETKFPQAKYVVPRESWYQAHKGMPIEHS